ncbi:PP2C family protein-serine/threonine phosphatase [Carbonactinospora thermoautotrophica]|uniref:PP2C family protein-serine/threonine phosphatase n=1 Tax=Carbonactinospora thermoautotrophica TaxID=1469144 RepID=UPI00082EA09E|nr:PP2C family protein-serine/threonine phosphatase [Carbonactinospora thermoautotrophica]
MNGLHVRAYADVAELRRRLRALAGYLGIAPAERARLVLAVTDAVRAALQSGQWLSVSVSLADHARPPALHVELTGGGEWPATAPGSLPMPTQRTPDGLVISLPLATLPAGIDLTAAWKETPPPEHAALEEELRAALDLAERRREQLVQVTEELEQTNRGTVALYVELEQRDEQLRQAHRKVFRELEDALRPPPPEVTGVELAVHYLPAQEDAPTGGDLYDWIVLPDGQLHVTVVDVMGHGVTSTRDALNVTHAVRILALEGHGLDTLIARANALLETQNPELFATVVVVRLDPKTGTVHIANGGHPPVLHLLQDREARYLEAKGRPLGYPAAGSDEVRTERLAPGDVLLLYTDGLVESTRDILVGLERLAKTARQSAALATAELPGAIVRAILGEHGHRDDTLALALRWTPDRPAGDADSGAQGS